MIVILLFYYAFSYNFMKILILMIKLRTYLLPYIWSKMLSASPDAFLKRPRRQLRINCSNLTASHCIYLVLKRMYNCTALDEYVFTVTLYSAMQSNWNSFGEDVVSDSLNKTSRDEDIILDKIYRSKYVRNIMMHDFKIKRKLIFNTTVALNPNFMSSLSLSAVFLLICIFFNRS